MRASFLLVLALALLVGLGVAVAVKTTGLLSPPAPVVQTIVPPPPPTPPPPPPPNVVVTTTNLFENDTVRLGDVKLRPATPAEAKVLEGDKNAFLAPSLEPTLYRFAARNITADTPLTAKDLADVAKPKSINERLAPGTRAVNVAATKENSAGGLVGVGDWVDVYLSTNVARTDEPEPIPYTGLIARRAQVIAKRDTLWPGFARIVNEPAEIQYTLAVNPYRSALIEYGRSVGHLSIKPVSGAEKKDLDAIKDAVIADPKKALALSVGSTDSPEARDEEAKIASYEKGNLTLGGDDLIAVFHLKPILPPPPPPVVVPKKVVLPPKPVTVEMFKGVEKVSTAVFPVPPPPPEPEPLPPPPPAPKPGKYLFQKPVEKPVEKAPAPKKL